LNTPSATTYSFHQHAKHLAPPLPTPQQIAGSEPSGLPHSFVLPPNAAIPQGRSTPQSISEFQNAARQNSDSNYVFLLPHFIDPEMIQAPESSDLPRAERSPDVRLVAIPTPRRASPSLICAQDVIIANKRPPISLLKEYDTVHPSYRNIINVSSAYPTQPRVCLLKLASNCPPIENSGRRLSIPQIQAR
jgi:hypothetical protein